MQKRTHVKPASNTIKIVLFDGFSNLCLANAIEPLRAANKFLGQDTYAWRVLTLNGDPVQSSSSLTIMPDGALSEIGDAARIFLISSYGYDDLYSEALGQILRTRLKSGSHIFGFDTGAWLMAKAGLLKRRKATIHWDVLSRFEEQFLSTNVINQPFVEDENVTTCGGAMATFDLMLGLIGEDCGPEVRYDVARLFVPILSHNRTSLTNDVSESSLTSRALSIMQDNIETPIGLTELSQQLGQSAKTIERAFKRDYNVPTGQIYKRLRLSSVREMVENTSQNFSVIAVRSGYKSASAMTRAFVSEFGYTPSELRSSVEKFHAPRY